jgi:hypothetical protein
MNYQTAKAKAESLWQANKDAAAVLDAFPRGPMGLTPDSVKATPEWKAARKACDETFEALRAFNSFYVKTFKAEIQADRLAKYSNK